MLRILFTFAKRQELSDSDLVGADEMALHYYAFLGDISMSSQDCALNEQRIPLLDFAIVFAATLSELAANAKATFDLTEGEGSIELERVSDRISIRNERSPCAIESSLLELNNAFESFRTNLISGIEHLWPTVIENGSYRTMKQKLDGSVMPQ